MQRLRKYAPWVIGVALLLSIMARWHYSGHRRDARRHANHPPHAVDAARKH